MAEDEIAIRRQGRAGHITLTRPKALNALTRGMIGAITAALDAWAGDPAIKLVVIDAEGDRAFCAGGDIAAIYRLAKAGEVAETRDFWRDEYRMNARLAAYPKPIVAFMHGIVMGGGVGIGGHLSHRIVGESSVIAMPECMIGLVPDVGSTHLLARAPGHVGEYLGLTGHRMDPADAIFAGFADRFVPLDRWPETKAALIETGDAAQAFAHAAPPPGESALEARQGAIGAAFAAQDLRALRAGLDAGGRGREIAAILDRQCALSMACTLTLIRAARARPGVREALAREYRFTWRSLSKGELVEGIRAAVIDKDRAPRWRDSIETLTAARVAAMLAPLGADELEL